MQGDVGRAIQYVDRSSYRDYTNDSNVIFGAARL